MYGLNDVGKKTSSPISGKSKNYPKMSEIFSLKANPFVDWLVVANSFTVSPTNTAAGTKPNETVTRERKEEASRIRKVLETKVLKKKNSFRVSRFGLYNQRY